MQPPSMVWECSAALAEFRFPNVEPAKNWLARGSHRRLWLLPVAHPLHAGSCLGASQHGHPPQLDPAFPLPLSRPASLQFPSVSYWWASHYGCAKFTGLLQELLLLLNHIHDLSYSGRSGLRTPSPHNLGLTPFSLPLTFNNPVRPF